MFLPAGVRQAILVLGDACVLALLAVLIWQGFSLTVVTWSLEFPAMEISRGYLYVSLPVGACLMVLAILYARRQPGGADPREGQAR
jgi:TRAP-type C4-dicarboxylate transport system permease small subunit